VCGQGFPHIVSHFCIIFLLRRKRETRLRKPKWRIRGPELVPGRCWLEPALGSEFQIPCFLRYTARRAFPTPSGAGRRLGLAEAPPCSLHRCLQRPGAGSSRQTAASRGLEGAGLPHPARPPFPRESPPLLSSDWLSGERRGSGIGCAEAAG
jgi:hypothetical protein